MTEVWFAYHPATGCWWTTGAHLAGVMKHESDWLVKPGQTQFNRDAWEATFHGETYVVSGRMVFETSLHVGTWLPLDPPEVEFVVRDGVTLEDLFAEDEG